MMKKRSLMKAARLLGLGVVALFMAAQAQALGSTQAPAQAPAAPVASAASAQTSAPQQAAHSAQGAHLPPATNYQLTQQSPVGLQNGKVVVYEFFSFTCPHCRDMFPSIHEWAEKAPHVQLVYVPVNWGPQFEPFMRLYYTLEALGRLDLMGAAYSAVQDQHNFDTPSLINWLVSEGISRDVAVGTFNSFSMGIRLRQATELGTTYNVQGTPTLIVNGTYLVSPGLFTTLGQHAAYEATLNTAKALANYVWQTQGKK